MFESLPMAPADPILGLTEAFKNDTNPEKINLGVGVYKDADGTTPILASVREAETRLARETTTKSYLPIPGAPAYGKAVQQMMFGAGHAVLEANRARTAHTPGGTGALRVASDFIARHLPGATVWMSDPTWANHPAIFTAAGLEQKTYAYYAPATKSLDFDAMIAALKNVPKGDVVLLHACCHNPSGVDPDLAQWEQIAEVAAEAGWLPLVDFAYQGFGTGLEEDAAGLRALAARVPELLICNSYSKNFSLYNDRVGGFTLVAADAEQADKAFSNVKPVIRTNYSNPPAHGGAIVATILGDADLTAMWQGELTEMRARINGMRKLFVETLAAKGVSQDFSFITEQRGMFSFSGLSREQVTELKEKNSIYIVGSGRINVAGISEANVDRLCTAIAAVL